MSNLPEVVSPKTTVAAFVPGEHHWDALEAYVDSGGNAAATIKASGLARLSFVALTRRRWWQDELEAINFVPVTSEMRGAEITKAAGGKALDRLTGDDYLSNRDLVALGRLGIEMQKDPSTTGGSQINIGHIHQLDLRGMSVEQLAILAAGDVERG